MKIEVKITTFCIRFKKHGNITIITDDALEIISSYELRINNTTINTGQYEIEGIDIIGVKYYNEI